MDLATSLMDYRTHQGERLPEIGVYYVFSEYSWPEGEMGLCKQFHIDLESVRSIAREEVQVPSIPLNPDLVVPEFLFDFRKESWLLRYLSGNRMQAIKTKVADEISFRDIAGVIAQVHFDQFLKRHPWVVDS